MTFSFIYAKLLTGRGLELHKSDMFFQEPKKKSRNRQKKIINKDPAKSRIIQ